MGIYFFISKCMAKKRWSVNDYKIVDATAVADWFEYTEVMTPGSSTGASSFGVTTPSTNTAGMQNVLVDAIYNATPTTRTEWQAGPLQADSLGNLKETLGTTIAGEDIPNDVLKVEMRNNATVISTATTTVCKTGAGLLHTITVTGGTAGTIVVYDNTAASGTILASFSSTNALATYTFNVSFSIGLTVVTSAATLVTVSAR